MGTHEPDSLLTSLRTGSMDPELLSLPFATVGDSVYTLARFAGYLASSGSRLTASTPDGRFRQAVDAWLDDRALAYEVIALADRDPDFARTMREFREGLMLFRLMEDSVWSAAATDSSALQAYFEAHRESFRFGDRHRILSIMAPSDSLLRDMGDRLSSGASYDDLVALVASDSSSSVRFDTTLVEGLTDSVYDRAVRLEPGQNTGIVGFGNGRIILVNDGIEPARAKTFEEARAEVVNAYQTVLEDRLVQRLRSEHQVEVFPERLNRAFAAYRAPSAAAATGS